jgi:hypothetical protein
VYRWLAAAIVLSATFAPLVAHAQVNIDQDKTPAHIYQSDCAVCHKAMRGLANGRSMSALTGFLAEHYTSSEQEAAAMASYVLAGGGGIGTAAPVRQGREQQPQHAQSTETGSRAAGRQPKTEADRAQSAKLPRSDKRSRQTREERSATLEPGRVNSERKRPTERREPVQHRETPTMNGAHERSQPAEVKPPKIEHATARVESTEPKPSKPAVAETTAGSSVTAPAASASAPVAPQPAATLPKPSDNIPD